MFDIPNTKTFMDSVHGYIVVPKCFVENIIDTDAFQRLRNIDQTGMKILYPNAKHDRFSHSLGVFHLGCKAVDSLLENFSQDDYWNISSDSNSIIYWAKNKVLFLIACLLHDIGHAPFSHSLEQIILTNSNEDKLLSQRLIERINEFENNYDVVTNIKASAHEKIGALYILDSLSDNIINIYDQLAELQYPTITATNILYSEHYNYNPIIKNTNLGLDMGFIVRMILGLKYTGYEPEKQIRNCFIELLNGNNFDVDKLDYIIRDTKMSGISNINIDIERLLNSVCIVTKTKYLNNINLCMNGVISSIKGNNSSSIEIAGRFRGVFLFDKEATIEIKKGSTFAALSTINQAKIKYAPYAEIASFSGQTKIAQNGEEISRTVGNDKVKYLPDKNGSDFECNIKNATVVSNDGFKFTTHNNPAQNSVVKLGINGECNIKITGNFKIMSPISCFEDTHINGSIQEAVFLGDHIAKEVPSTQTFNEFVIGFNKQAINVIANVLEARDYLYLWVYAHHKVIYYANFLIPAISSNLLSAANIESFSPWKLNYDNLIFLDDAYVWTVIKHFHHSSNEPIETLKICSELLSRKYKFSLYKSLAEYDLLFEEFTYQEKMLIKKFFIDSCNLNLPHVISDNITAGYINDSVINDLKKFGGLENIKNIVYVDASYSSKKINVNNTFIKMHRDVLAPISEIPLLADRVSKVGNTNQYFYLYFETATTNSQEVKKETELLSHALVHILKTNIKSM